MFSVIDCNLCVTNRLANGIRIIMMAVRAAHGFSAGPATLGHGGSDLPLQAAGQQVARLTGCRATRVSGESRVSRFSTSGIAGNPVHYPGTRTENWWLSRNSGTREAAHGVYL
jgi:hypothetical protein